MNKNYLFWITFVLKPFSNMSSTLLDFEKPLEELQEQLSQAKKIAEKGKVNVESVIKDLESKIEHTKKELYRHGIPEWKVAMPWQKLFSGK